MSGPAPKPTALKILAGNPGHRKLNDAEPQFGNDMPECPRHLTGEAKREWFRVITELHQAGLLKTVDRGALAGYCQTWARWVASEQALKKEELVLETEKGYRYQNPRIGIANAALDEMRKFMVEFGMTPASRSRVRVQKPEEADPFEEWARKKLEE